MRGSLKDVFDKFCDFELLEEELSNRLYNALRAIDMEDVYDVAVDSKEFRTIVCNEARKRIDMAAERAEDEALELLWK